MQHTRLWKDGKLEETDFDCARISDHLEERGKLVWLDLTDPTAAELDLIKDEFGLDDYALEDATADRQRPKLDRFKDHVFIAVHGVRFDAPTAHLSVHRVNMFLGRGYLITVRKGGGLSMKDIVDGWDDDPRATQSSQGLLHSVLDHIVDEHLDVTETMEDAVDSLEDEIFDSSIKTRELQKRTFAMRKAVVALRRVALPMRDVVLQLTRGSDWLSDEMRPAFEDVLDHVLRVGEATDSIRDLLATVVDTSLSVQSNTLNEVMKKLTSYAALIAFPTLVTGFAGMNVPYPGFMTHGGWYAILAVLILGTIALYTGFKKRNWL